MLDEKILKFLHENHLVLVGMSLNQHTINVTVTIKKVKGGVLVVGRADKVQGDADDALRSALEDALGQMGMLSDLVAALQKPAEVP